MEDLQDCDDALHRFHPLIPVSGTGTGSLIPLPSRERGNLAVVLVLLLPVRLTSGLRIKSAMTCDDAGAWGVPCPVDSRLRGNDGEGRGG